ncbi:MAG TPA: cytochrome C oxidase subunit II, partial [Albitalea sp.]
MNWLDAPGSHEARALADVGWVLVAGAFAVFALTMALLALALRGRLRAVPAAWWIAGGGIAVPALVLTALLVYAVARTAGLERAPAGSPLVVGVTGHLWWWEVRYHDAASGRWIALANELRLPAGRPVQIGLTSADVIHSFWVPTLGGKMDLVPGRTNRLVVTAQAEGVHRGVCAEYCGTQHAKMALHVVVLPPAAFEQWLAGQATAAAPPAEPIAERGRQAFLAHGCAGCHAVRGIGGEPVHGGHAQHHAAVQGAAVHALLGPDLTHVASRLHLGAGTLRTDRAAFARWVTGVQDLKPGARMPSFD